MTRKKIYLILQTVLCLTAAVLLIAGVIQIYREGMAVREAGDLRAVVFSEERVGNMLRRVSPVLFVTIGTALAGLVLGIREDRKVRPGAAGQKNEASSEKKEEMAAGKQAGRTSLIRNLILALAVICIIAGVMNGTMRDVFVKASVICSECIGLG